VWGVGGDALMVLFYKPHLFRVICYTYTYIYIYTPFYLGSFDTNYIIFRNVEIFKKKNLK
jgi:hypothetical protein